MKRGNNGFSVVDLLIIIALLLIVIGMFGPLVKRSGNKTTGPAVRAAVVLPTVLAL
jgi:hypothetical protein